MPTRRHRWEPGGPAPTGLVVPVPVDPLGIGGPTRGQAAGPHWRRTSHGLYVPADVDGSMPEQRILEQATRLPPEGAVTGWAACRLHGASFFDGLLPDGCTRMPVPLVVGPQRRIRRDDNVTVSYERLGVVDRVTRYGIACATVRRGLFDAMRGADSVREAVVSMDMMAAAELTSIRRMRDYCATRPGWAGVRQMRAALDLASEDSRSPNETRMRLVWVLDAGLPVPAVNQPVYDLRGPAARRRRPPRRGRRGRGRVRRRGPPPRTTARTRRGERRPAPAARDRGLPGHRTRSATAQPARGPD